MELEFFSLPCRSAWVFLSGLYTPCHQDSRCLLIRRMVSPWGCRVSGVPPECKDDNEITKSTTLMEAI